MGIAFLEAMQPVQDENADAQPLVCTCQMFGSGKTSLGRAWKAQFFSPDFKAKYHQKLMQRYPPKALQQLENSVYVHVKLQVMRAPQHPGANFPYFFVRQTSRTTSGHCEASAAWLGELNGLRLL